MMFEQQEKEKNGFYKDRMWLEEENKKKNIFIIINKRL
jgi:hypothetical protein